MNIRIVKTMLCLTFVLVIAQIAQAQMPCDVPQLRLPMIDDFTTGKYRANLREGENRHVQRGANVIGCYRLTRFIVPSANPFNQTATLDIRRQGALVVSTDYKVPHRLEVKYGVDALGENAPLNLNLSGSGYDRFRVRFDANDSVVNFNIVVFTGTAFAQLGYNVEAGNLPFDVDFPFADFGVGTGVDFHDIDFIVLVLQSGNAIGSNDYAITSVSVAGGAAVP